MFIVDVLQEFRSLFVDRVSKNYSKALQALYEIAFENDEEEFRNTLKRSCYILINNWYASRQYQPIQELIELFENPKLTRGNLSPTLDKLGTWLLNFINSKDYEELKLFAARYDGKEHWANRFASYLLVPQYIDLSNPIEQREAARAVSQKLKDQFKFELAMYTARSESGITTNNHRIKNPTGLGDDVLRLIKAIVIRRGPFSHASLAHIFIQQNHDINYKVFKENLLKYLLFYVGNKEFYNLLGKQLSEKLELLYEDYHDETLTNVLLFRTCNRVIECLISENKKEPSDLFILLLTQGHALRLVVILVKIVLICKNVRSHLEASMATVIRYYEKFPESECQWVINFLEIFNITFAIYGENVQYNLVQMQGNNGNCSRNNSTANLDAYRIFSQSKQDINSNNGLQEMEC
jgi:hypothetical protein